MSIFIGLKSYELRQVCFFYLSIGILKICEIHICLYSREKVFLRKVIIFGLNFVVRTCRKSRQFFSLKC
ncbi:MAG: hypothetical protein C0403_07970 [Desulfobacterium sp.]|nr:hypothetical protein [Desulfobacterium sp.]